MKDKSLSELKEQIYPIIKELRYNRHFTPSAVRTFLNDTELEVRHKYKK